MDNHPHPLGLCGNKFRLTSFITHCAAHPNLYSSPHPYTRTDLYSYGYSNRYGCTTST